MGTISPLTHDLGASEQALGQPDEFSSVSWKLAILLGLRQPDRVLLVGGVPEHWRTSLRADGMTVRSCATALQASSIDGKFNCIIWFHGHRENFRRASKIIESALAENGRLLVFCRHRWSLFRGRQSVRSLLDPTLHSLPTYERLLREAGVTPESRWLPWPAIDNAEEYLFAGDAAEFSASTGASSTFAALRALGHEGFAIIARRHKGEKAEDEVAFRIIEAVRPSLGNAETLRVSRFDMRERGALVIMLRSGANRTYVARICKPGKLAAHLDANEHTLESLRAAAADDAVLLRYIPRPARRLEAEGHVVWLEERLPGTIAWRLPTGLRRRLDRDWVEFLQHLSIASNRTDRLNLERFPEVLRRWNIEPSALPRELGTEIAKLESWLTKQLSHRPCLFTWSHGDFGYGNLLADSRNGSLQAVIDWETGSSKEFLGVDWMNMLLMRERELTGCVLGDAVLRVTQRLSMSSRSDPTFDCLRSLMEANGCEPNWQQTLAGIALARIVQRQARYPLLLARRLRDFVTALRTFRATVGF